MVGGEAEIKATLIPVAECRVGAYNLLVDPTLPLAFSVRSGPGVYAVLLGSGVSRAAGIPTGWDVTLDLISKLGAASGAAGDAEADPAAWFRDAYREEPDYSRVVDHLAATPADRQSLLKGYFEPTEEEREEGKKTPTEAHRAAARLAAKGYVRVIVTTNFDRLMERALEAESVNPTVVSTPDAAEGAPPLQHADCTVVKVHGDLQIVEDGGELYRRLHGVQTRCAETGERRNA